MSVLFLIPAGLILWFGVRFIVRFLKATGPTVMPWALLLLSAFHVFFVFFGPWSKEEAGDGVFSSTGGAGFGVVAAVLSIALLVLSLLRVAGKHSLLPGLGVDQASLAVALAAFLNVIGYFVVDFRPAGWGSGWAWVPPYFMIQLIPASLAAQDSVRARPLTPSQQRALGIGAIGVGALMALLPFLSWVEVSAEDLTEKLTGYEPNGPHLTYFLAIIGVALVIIGIMRLRPQGVAEPGHLLTIGHVLTILGLTATLLPLAYLLFASQTDGIAPQIGVILSVLAGLALLGLGYAELRMRRAGAA